MSWATERATIYSRFDSIWDPVTLGPVSRENQNFQEPEGICWVDIKIINFTSQQMSIGNDKKLYRHLGEFQCDIYIPSNRGSHEGRARADVIKNGFLNYTTTTSDGNRIQFRVPSLRQLAPNERRALNLEDSRFILVVRCPFYRDEFI